MLDKISNCEYCGNELKDHTAKKRFCNTKCRVYYNRDLSKGVIEKRKEHYRKPPKGKEKKKAELRQLPTEPIETTLPTLEEIQSIPNHKPMTKVEMLQWMREKKNKN